jgi:protein-tyrosine phosphatase
MDRKNWEEVLRLEPSALRKLIWIGAFNPSGPVEVEDPYNQDEEKTRKIIRQLEDNTEKLISKLCSS